MKRSLPGDADSTYNSAQNITIPLKRYHRSNNATSTKVTYYSWWLKW